MYGTLDISTSGMIAQRTRMAAIAANMANIGTILNSNGEYEPYQRRAAMFAPGDPGAASEEGRALGVHVAEIFADPEALRLKYDPGNPHADKDGYIMVPDIDPMVEQINALEAGRAYEANVAAAETTKSMMAQALRLLA